MAGLNASTDREVADALWEMFAALGARDGLGGMEYRRALLGQTDEERRARAQTEGPDSRVAEWAQEGRRAAERLGEIDLPLPEWGGE